MSAVKTSVKTDPIQIESPQIERFKLVVRGISSLITHRFSQKARKQIEEAGSSKKRKGAPRPPRDPEGSFKDSLYIMEDGRYGFPVSGIKKAMVRASKSIEGLTMTDARGMFFIEADGFDDDTGQDLFIVNGKPTIREDLVRVKSGAVDLRYRGEFRKWTAAITIAYDAGLITKESVCSILERAGQTIGIGEWRPEKDGDHGRFTLNKKEQK